MSPKEKASELYWKYYHLIEHKLNGDYDPHGHQIAIEHAIIAVDEIMESCDGIFDDFICDQETYGDKHYSRMTTYWIDVKGKLEIMK